MTGLLVTVTPPFLLLTSSRRFCSQGAYMINGGIQPAHACSHFESTLTSGFLLILFQNKPSRLAFWAKIPIVHNEKLSKRKEKHFPKTRKTKFHWNKASLTYSYKLLSFQGLIFSPEDPVCNFSCFAVNHLHLFLQAEVVAEDQWYYRWWGNGACSLLKLIYQRTCVQGLDNFNRKPS